MTPEFLQASLSGDRSAAARIIGVEVPESWLEERWLIQLRLNDLAADPTWLPWLLRAMVRRSDQTMVGHIGFHGPAGADSLAPYAPGGAELGYTVFPEHRRQGYAREACLAMMSWAAREHGVSAFVLSISPDNEPSQRIAAALRFQKVGSHEDEKDGLEEIFVLRP